MSITLEQLCSGQHNIEDVEHRMKKIKEDMATRSIALATLQEAQGMDKRELKFLTHTLENYNASRKKAKRSQYIRKSVHTLEEVFAMVGQGRIVTEEGHTINTDSIRYKLFKQKGIICVTCGLAGKFFAKEKDSKESEEVYHFNLYGIKDGKEVLFTRDHIQPRCKGGKDTLENLQTMCSPCNCAKGSDWDGEE